MISDEILFVSVCIYDVWGMDDVTRLFANLDGRKFYTEMSLYYLKNPFDCCDQYTVWTVVHGIGWLQDYSAGLKQELIGWQAWAAGFDMIGVAGIQHPKLLCWISVTSDSDYNDVIMNATASQIASLTIVYSSDYSGADQRKHQSSASLAFLRGIHRWPVNSPHKWPVTRKMFPFDDVIMVW